MAAAHAALELDPQQAMAATIVAGAGQQ